MTPLICLWCAREVSRDQAMPHIAEFGCKEGWAQRLPSGFWIRIDNVTGLNALSLDRDDLSLDEFDGIDGDGGEYPADG